MTLALVSGLGFGAAVAVLLAALFPSPPRMGTRLEHLDSPRPLRIPKPFEGSRVASQRSWFHGATFSLERRLEQHPALLARLSPDLAITGTDLSTTCRRAIAAGGAGGLLPSAFLGLVELGGVHMTLLVPLWLAVVGAGCASLLPVVHLRRRASTARREARRVIATFLDLIVLSLAAGMGVESALHSAAELVSHPVGRRILDTLHQARDAGVVPWQALAQLGRDWSVSELVELSAAVGLAGTEGSRIRSTLVAKASSMRHHELAEAESEANTITEKLFLPGVLVLMGFLLLIGYPAFSHIATGL